jgi:SAM-dependent methyltransferase
MTNQEQSASWNGASGRAWVDEQALLDGMFAAFEGLLAAAASEHHARAVLDVGCGAGATTLAIARKVGAAGVCEGVDISEPLITAARERAAREHGSARFLVADAQTHAFAPAQFDLLVSRFGVMFFADPVAAFANLRRAMRDGGAMCVLAFRSVAENEFMTTAERAVGPLLPSLPPRIPDAPGQFAFANGERVRRILGEAGWTSVQLTPIDVPCSFPAAALPRYFARFGPAGLALQQADEATRTRLLEKLHVAFARYLAGDEVRFTAACWRISACR